MLTVIIISIIVYLVALIGMIYNKEGKEYNNMWYFSFIFMIILAIISLSIRLGYREGYRKGQINALTGTVKYKLVTRQDSTSKWIEIERK